MAKGSADDSRSPQADPLNKELGKRVRIARNLTQPVTTQKALAAAVGIKFQQIQKYEKGANRIPASRLKRIADVLQQPITFFFEKPGEQLEMPVGEAHTMDVEKLLSDQPAIDLAKQFSRVPTHLRWRVVSAMVAVIDVADPAQPAEQTS